MVPGIVAEPLLQAMTATAAEMLRRVMGRKARPQSATRRATPGTGQPMPLTTAHPPGDPAGRGRTAAP